MAPAPGRWGSVALGIESRVRSLLDSACRHNESPPSDGQLNHVVDNPTIPITVAADRHSAQANRQGGLRRGVVFRICMLCGGPADGRTIVLGRRGNVRQWVRASSIESTMEETPSRAAA